MACYFCSEASHASRIVETKFWNIKVASKQPWLGYCMVALKRHAGDIADLTSDEWIELHEIMKKLESAVRTLFNPQLFNWSCLMNNAFQDEQPQPHVHLHMRPRYAAPVIFEQITFVDDQFGHHYNYQQPSIITPEAHAVLMEKIKAAYL